MRSKALLRKASITHMKQEDILRCPHAILMHGHYNLDGSCRCYDPHHRLMLEWGYVWDHGRMVWIANPEE